jgi:hypothetical protein
MPTLKKMLQTYDQDLICRIGSFWGVDTANLDASSAIDEIYQIMVSPIALSEELNRLPQSVRDAWYYAAANAKKVTWAQFTRKFGAVREFGPAKRNREQPEVHPVSATETLWYRGLIGRAFMNLPPEPREFVFIPDEIMPNQPTSSEPILSGLRPAQPSEYVEVRLADLRILDHATDWLAATRVKRALPGDAWLRWMIDENFLLPLIRQTCPEGLDGHFDAEKIKSFLSDSRQEIQSEWFALWLESLEINDLRALPGLVFEGNWHNDPCKPRSFLIELLDALAPAMWYSLPSLVGAIKAHHPDFQRPSGDYDSWFIRRATEPTYMRGIQSWEAVDGALIQSLICGPLHWLGLVDLGSKSHNAEFAAFRIAARFREVVNHQPTSKTYEDKINAHVTSDLKLNVPTGTSRLFRYQVGRFCEIIKLSASETVYQPSPNSLLLAEDQGLKITQFVQYLEKNLAQPLPKNWAHLAARWEQNHLEASVERKVVIHTKTAETLQSLLNHPKANKIIVEVLNPTTASLQADAVEVIEKVLVEMGILLQNDLDV